MEILTGEQMRNVDRRAIDELGIPGLLLMESAGSGIVDALFQDHPDLASRAVVILCGGGNNGGDGFVIARHLVRRGLAARVGLLGDAKRLKGDAAINHRAATAGGVEIREITDEAGWRLFRTGWPESPIVVDAILGTGIRGGAAGLPGRAIEDLNDSGCYVVSVDLPSGLDADRPTVPGVAVRAARTYTLCRPKLALVLGASAELAGSWRVVPIGIPDAAVRKEGAKLEWLDGPAVHGLLSPRPEDSHKASYGHLLAVAGSAGKSGAAVLLARGALRSGVGLITVATGRSSQERVAVQQAEVMTEALPETASGFLGRAAIGRVHALLASLSALAIGPGLGDGAATRSAVLGIVDRRRAPMVIDADGLNAFTGARGKPFPPPGGGRHPLVLTPHPGEAGRLLGWSSKKVQADRLGAARRLARSSRATVVLKGHRTLVARPDGRVSINGSGNPGMATAGTGDVLTGMVGAFLARGLDGWDAARLAVHVHGVAGDRASEAHGVEAMIAGDLVEQIPAALSALAGARRW